MDCHIPHCSAQHTDPLWLPDFGASATCFLNTPGSAAARQNSMHMLIQCMHYTDRRGIQKHSGAKEEMYSFLFYF